MTQNQANTFFEDKTGVYTHVPPVIVCDHLRTPENMGAVIRLAGNIGCRQVFFVQSQEQTPVRLNKLKKTASTAFDHVDWCFCSLEELMSQSDLASYHWVALETSEQSKNIFQHTMPPKMVLVVGNESFGTSCKLLAHCLDHYYIPLLGGCKSMNVVHALNVGLMRWVAQYLA